jgi:hypothetical protein
MSLTTYRFGIVDDDPGIAPSAATSAYPPKAKRRELSGVTENDTPPERGGYILLGSFVVVVVVVVAVLVVVGEDEDEDDDEEYVSGESRSIHSAEYSRRCLVMARLLDVVALVLVVVVVVVAAVRIGVIATTTCERRVVGEKP